MAIDAVASRRPLVTTPLRRGLFALRMTCIALRQRMLALQSKAGPISMIEGAERRGLKTARFMAASTVAATLNMVRQAFALKNPVMRARVTADATTSIPGIVFRDEAKAAWADTCTVASCASGLTVSAVQRKAGPRLVIECLVQLLKLRHRMTAITTDSACDRLRQMRPAECAGMHVGMTPRATRWVSRMQIGHPTQSPAGLVG